MIRLGVRLTVGGGKEAAVRLILTAAAVGLGVGLLLVTLAGMNAINAQNARTAWLTATFGPARVSHLPGTTQVPADPLWWLSGTDRFGDQTIDRVDVAATGPHAPVPPGVPGLPGPGQFYASPALSRLLRSTPAAELANRFPGAQIGTIGPAALPAPNSLIIVVGRTAQDLSHVPGAEEITSINTDPQHGGPTGFDATKLKVILAVGVLALLFPVLILIGTAARLAAARREQRFAAMRLVGATPRQVSVIAAVEAAVAALIGVAVGFGVFFVLRPILTNVPFTGSPFAPGDLSLGWADVMLVVVGIPLAAAGAARLALRRVASSPLGVSRRVTPPVPRAYRLIPLAAGIAELAYFVGAGRPNSSGGQVWAFLLGGLLLIAGLVIAGPWLTMMGSRVMTRRADRPAALIAGRRLADDPRAAFRSISGLVVALFVTSAAAGIITTILADHGATAGGLAANGTLVDLDLRIDTSPQRVHPTTNVASIPASAIARLRSTPGVQGVTVIHSDPNASPRGLGAIAPSGVAASTGLVECAQLAHTPVLGRCAPAAGVATITADLAGAGQVIGGSNLATTVWPAAADSAERVQGLPAAAVVVATDGSTSAIERARTALESALPDWNPPATFGAIDGATARLIAELQQMVRVVIIVSLVIAGCSLAVGVTAGVSDRKRPFSLLRLAGVPLGVLRRVVALEAAVPLLLVAVVAVGTGLLSAELFLRSQLDESLRAPGLAYVVILVAGLAASLGIIAATLPLIERITGPEVARNG